MKIVNMHDVRAWYLQSDDLAEFIRSIGRLEHEAQILRPIDLPLHLQYVIQAKAAETPGLWEKLQAGIPPVYDIREHTEVVHDMYRKLLGRSSPEDEQGESNFGQHQQHESRDAHDGSRGGGAAHIEPIRTPPRHEPTCAEHNRHFEEDGGGLTQARETSRTRAVPKVMILVE